MCATCILPPLALTQRGWPSAKHDFLCVCVHLSLSPFLLFCLLLCLCLLFPFFLPLPRPPLPSLSSSPSQGPHCPECRLQLSGLSESRGRRGWDDCPEFGRAFLHSWGPHRCGGTWMRQALRGLSLPSKQQGLQKCGALPPAPLRDSFFNCRVHKHMS